MIHVYKRMADEQLKQLSIENTVYIDTYKGTFESWQLKELYWGFVAYIIHVCTTNYTL